MAFDFAAIKGVLDHHIEDCPYHNNTTLTNFNKYVSGSSSIGAYKTSVVCRKLKHVEYMAKML
jgi:hypothetical protein